MQKVQRKFWEKMNVEDVPEDFIETFDGMSRLYMLYDCAIREIHTKLENLNREMEFVKERNPIQHITYRLKKPRSIIGKLQRYGMDITVNNIWENINDVAALRVICSYVDDIYAVADMLTKQDDVILLKQKDYIKSPKESGYRSLHLIVEVPVFLSEEKTMVKVEIQIRSIAMDFWASLEHQLRYKVDTEIPDDIRQKLKASAENVYTLDQEMQEIYKKIEKLKSKEETVH